ncbi:Arc family DNA-binding protein [Nitratireductor sp. PBL-C9]|uniref:Arc family DNA-binding protein n=1 Tax=Nitratireductor sp. PBL-C9 TaxID=3435013 RepID=UPI003D7CEC3A
MAENRSKSDGFMLRFPDGMRGRIKAAAEANNRSMNAEIIATLEEAYPENEFDLAALLSKLSAVLHDDVSEEERRRAVEHANAELKASQAGWRLEVSTRNGQKQLTFEAILDDEASLP